MPPLRWSVMPELPAPVEAMLDSWELSMRARNLAPKTIGSYRDSAAQLVVHADAADVTTLTREHVRAYLADLAGRAAPATASFRFRALQQLFKWLAAEDEIDVDPIAGMDPPVVPEQPVAVLELDDLKLLLKACDGKGFAERRDTAILRLFIDTGVRLEEIAGLTLDAVDLRERTARVLGKGRRERVVPFGVNTAQAVDRYLRARARHRHATSTSGMWLGAKGKGALTANGVYQMVKRRAGEAGITLHPHQFRHTFAHHWLDGGGKEGDLMQLAGWKSRTMLGRYGASAAAARARRAHGALSLGDQL